MIQFKWNVIQINIFGKTFAQWTHFNKQILIFDFIRNFVFVLMRSLFLIQLNGVFIKGLHISVFFNLLTFKGIQTEIYFHIHFVTFKLQSCQIFVNYFNRFVMYFTSKLRLSFGFFQIRFLIYFFGFQFNLFRLLKLSQLIHHFHKQVSPWQNWISQISSADFFRLFKRWVSIHEIQVSRQIVVLHLSLDRLNRLWTQLGMQSSCFGDSILT